MAWTSLFVSLRLQLDGAHAAVDTATRQHRIRSVMQAKQRTSVGYQELPVDVQQRAVVAVDEEGVVRGIAARQGDVACAVSRSMRSVDCRHSNSIVKCTSLGSCGHINFFSGSRQTGTRCAYRLS